MQRARGLIDDGDLIVHFREPLIGRQQRDSKRHRENGQPPAGNSPLARLRFSRHGRGIGPQFA